MSLWASWLAWRQRDGFTASYFVWFLSLLVLFISVEELDAAFQLYLLLVPLLLALALPTIVFLLFALRRDIALRRWRRLASWIAGLLIAIGIVSVLAQLGFDPTWARLALTRERYERIVADVPRNDDAPRFKTFEWGDTGGAGAVNVFRTLIYDESDEVAREPARRSLAWRDRMLASEEGSKVLRHDARATLKRISGHFYLLTEYDQ